jgi:hypothetical protein
MQFRHHLMGPGEAQLRPTKETAVNLASHAFESSRVEVCAIFGLRTDFEEMCSRSANLWCRTDRSVEARTYL